jgi:hypothetical protein
MSDNTAARKIKHLEELAHKAGAEISPERMQEIRQKFETEQHELAKLDEQTQAKLNVQKQESERPALRRDIPALGGAADARLQRTEANSAASADTSATPPTKHQASSHVHMASARCSSALRASRKRKIRRSTWRRSD